MFGSAYVQEPILAVVPRPCPNRGCARYVTQLHFCHAASNMANITSIIVGVFFYDLFFYSGSDSILSKRYVMPLPPQSSSIVALLMRSSFLSSDKFASEKLPENGETQHLSAGHGMV